jgi:hypothetical protein
VGHPGNVQIIAAKGGVAPGFLVGETFNGFSDPVINSAGHVAFSGSISESTARGIWSNRTGTLDLVVRNGEAAPGTLNGVLFGSVAVPVLNDANHLTFLGVLTGDGITTSNDTGIWSDRSGTMQLIAREGDVAPGAPSDVVFGQFDANSYVLNANGQIAFLGRLTGANVTTANDVGIWATDSTGELQLIAREGDQFEVGSGDVRTIRELMFFTGTGNADSRPSGFNDLGQLAFWASFDHTGISFTPPQGVFVSYRVAESIPGDFNADGTVDAADYLVWRKTDGTQLGYNTWRSHFGVSLPPVQVVASAVPEPAAIVLLAVAVSAIGYRRSNRARAS